MKCLKPLKLFEESCLNKNIFPAGYGLLGLDITETEVTLAFTNPITTYSKALLPLSKKEPLDYIAYCLRNVIGDNKLGGIVAGSSCIENKGEPDVGQVKKLIDELHKEECFDGLKYTYWDRKLISTHMERKITVLF